KKVPPPENPMTAARVRWEHIQRIYTTATLRKPLAASKCTGARYSASSTNALPNSVFCQAFRNSSGSLAMLAAIRASFILMLLVGRAILAVASAMTLFVALLALASAMASLVGSAVFVLGPVKLPVLCWRY